MSEALNAYIKEIRKNESLSKDDSIRLVKQAQEGDTSAAEVLIESNLLLVVSIARKYLNMGVELNELISLGNEGLIIAISKYKFKEEGNPASFSSVASFWIKSNITRQGLFNRHIVHVPENHLELQKDGRWEGTYYSQCSIDSKDDDGNDLHEILPDTSVKDPIVQSEHMSSVQKMVNQSLVKLSTKELFLIENHYGLGEREELSIMDLAVELNSTKTVVEKGLELALLKMKGCDFDKLTIKQLFIVNNYYGVDEYKETSFTRLSREMNESTSSIEEQLKEAKRTMCK